MGHHLFADLPLIDAETDGAHPALVLQVAHGLVAALKEGFHMR